MRSQCIDAGVKIEALLRKKGAQGKGLAELRESISNQLSAETVADLRFITHIRNSAAHDADFDINKETLKKFKSSVNSVSHALKQKKRAPRKEVFSTKSMNSPRENGFVRWINKLLFWLNVTVAVGVFGVLLFTLLTAK